MCTLKNINLYGKSLTLMLGTCLIMVTTAAPAEVNGNYEILLII